MKYLYELLRTGTRLERTPVWFMRQAGRFLPEYRQLRSQYANFMSFCGNPQAASEATLQPLKRFDVDAAIIFSDILVIPAALGQEVRFEANIGPILGPLDQKSIDKTLSLPDLPKQLSSTVEAISLTKQSLSKTQTMIGFAGAPWTILCYMLEQKGSKTFDGARTKIASDFSYAKHLVNAVTESTIHYLKAQIQAGADVIKLFDSWAGLCPHWLRDSMIIDPMRHIISELKHSYPNTPIIYFPKGVGDQCVRIVNTVKADCAAFDHFVDPKEIKDNLQNANIAIQGGLDPMVMKVGGKILEDHIEFYMRIFKDSRYIFNLGHGMVPDMPIDHVIKTITMIRKLSQ